MWPYLCGLWYNLLSNVFFPCFYFIFLHHKICKRGCVSWLCRNQLRLHYPSAPVCPCHMIKITTSCSVLHLINLLIQVPVSLCYFAELWPLLLYLMCVRTTAYVQLCFCLSLICILQWFVFLALYQIHASTLASSIWQCVDFLHPLLLQSLRI